MQSIRRILISVFFAASSSSAIATIPRFALTGMPDAKVEAFFLKLQHAVNTHDVNKLAAMAAYPLVVNGKSTVPNSHYFEKHYNVIFTKTVVTAVERQKYKALFGNDQGVMIGNGELWFSGVCRDASCKQYQVRIIAINN